jgi:hypothetical protein
MGAWQYIQDTFLDRFDKRLTYLGRPTQASPAVASQKAHGKEQAALLNAAVGPAPGGDAKGEHSKDGGSKSGAGAAGGKSADGEDGPAPATKRTSKTFPART